MSPELAHFSSLTSSVLPVAGFPLEVRPSAGLASSSVAAEIRACVREELGARGAILFRGFSTASAEDFESFARTVTPELLSYEFGSTPRSEIQGRIYTSTEYPAHQHIPLHNEQSYTTEWPLKIWFFCARAANPGGATPLADSRAVLAAIPPRIRDRFEAKRVMYVRNYGNGLDLPWQKVFGTSERSVVERFCAQMGIACEWNEDGELRTRQVCQAIAEHPVSRERVWFNQAHLFHVSNLEPSVREGLLAALGEEELPRNAYYGDGSPIEEAVLEEVRAAYRACTVEFPWQTGDVLLLDNMLVAHGRGPYQGARKVLVAMAEPYPPARGGEEQP
jgi:alpha-ketoglutarate-dependent taurine dioxygenase